MSVLVYLVPVALLFGLAGLAAFLWAVRSGQYEDMDGAGERILIDAEPSSQLRNERPAAHSSSNP